MSANELNFIRLEDTTGPEVIFTVTYSEACDDFRLEVDVYPNLTLNVEKRQEVSVSYCKLRLHVGKPRVEACVVGHLGVHDTVFFLLNGARPLAPGITSVNADSLLPLSAALVEAFFDVYALAHQKGVFLVRQLLVSLVLFHQIFHSAYDIIFVEQSFDLLIVRGLRVLEFFHHLTLTFKRDFSEVNKAEVTVDVLHVAIFNDILYLL